METEQGKKYVVVHPPQDGTKRKADRKKNISDTERKEIWSKKMENLKENYEREMERREGIYRRENKAWEKTVTDLDRQLAEQGEELNEARRVMIE